MGQVAPSRGYANRQGFLQTYPQGLDLDQAVTYSRYVGMHAGRCASMHPFALSSGSNSALGMISTPSARCLLQLHHAARGMEASPRISASGSGSLGGKHTIQAQGVDGLGHTVGFMGI